MCEEKFTVETTNTEELNYEDSQDEGSTLYPVCDTLARKLNALVAFGYAHNVEELIFKILVTVCKNHEVEISAYEKAVNEICRQFAKENLKGSVLKVTPLTKEG